MNKTKIPWVKNPDGSQGFTWNPLTGCLNHIKGICKGGNFPCYAYKLANGRLRTRYLANTMLAPLGLKGKSPVMPRHYNNPFYPRFWEDRLGLPIEHPTPMRPAKRKGIFVCDMSDLFGIGISESWTEQVMTTIKLCPYHRFYLLTKQPQNLIKFSPFPKDCYVGITVTKPEFLLPALDALDSIQCSVRYLSIEPMLARFDVPDLSLLLAGSVDWLILGSQTKPYRPPTIEAVKGIVEACNKAGIPVFLKDNLVPLLSASPNSDKAKLFYSEMGLRQEMPTIH